MCVIAIPVLFVIAIPCVFVFAIRCVFLCTIPGAIVRRGKGAIDGVGACCLLAKCIQLFKLHLVNQLLSLKLQGDGCRGGGVEQEVSYEGGGQGGGGSISSAA